LIEGYSRTANAGAEEISASYVHKFLPFIGFPHYNFESPRRAFRDAGAAAIAKSFGNKAQFVLHDPESAFHAVLHAFAAAIAQ
jgi:hypothetical protein